MGSQTSNHIKKPSINSSVLLSTVKKKKDKKKGGREEKAIKIFLKLQHHTLVGIYLTSTVFYFRKCENLGANRRDHIQ